jgi:phosphoglycerol transferase MdoB-like AlkP superfamily enzyme
MPTTYKESFFRVSAGFLGVAVIAGTSAAFLQPPDTVKWDNSYDSAAVYESFSDTKKSLLLSGIYQYTFRDFCRTCFGAGSLFKGPKNEAAFASLDTYFDGANSEPAENEMTGVLAGKNLILIQLEAIDTWLLTEETMPNLYRIKQKSLDFMNHYAAVYITAGTFNTEFIVNTGLIPPSSGVPITVYSENAFPYSLPRLFRNAGYSANSFHGSPGTVYGREAIHLNWGYERYHSGIDLGMDDYTMDSQLLNGYDQMVSDSKFFDLIITYSGHGPYTMDSAASAAN